MLKAMLIISSLGGGNDFTVEMPTMEDCLAARIEIQKQDDSLKTLCIPSVDETAKVQEFFDIFMDMIQELKREGESDGIDRFEQCDRQWDKCNEQSHSESIRSTE
tara:strand:+ start:51 stop:365 length:315 start_codon:yes stop_codon:yes gene_type:complete